MSYALLNENAFALCFFFLDLRQVRIIVDLRIVLRTHTDNKLDVVVMYELYIYKISVLCCFQCAVRCVFSSELLYISITDKLCQYLFFIFLKFFSLKPSAFRSELININIAVSACQYIFYFLLKYYFQKKLFEVVHLDSSIIIALSFIYVNVLF